MLEFCVCCQRSRHLGGGDLDRRQVVVGVGDGVGDVVVQLGAVVRVVGKRSNDLQRSECEKERNTLRKGMRGTAQRCDAHCWRRQTPTSTPHSVKQSVRFTERDTLSGRGKGRR